MKKIIPVFIIISACLLVSGCKNTSTEAQQTAAEYSVIKISSTDQIASSSYSASIRGKQDIEIYPQVSGFITQLCVKEGQRVRKGQILFVIDQVPYETALATAKANVEAARAGVSSAQLSYNSKKELFDQNVVSEYERLTSENNLLTAKAQLAQAEAQALSTANNLSYTEVKSPCDGVVGNLPYRVGALVSATMPQPLTTVSDNSEMYVYFSMTENQFLNLVRQYGSKDEALKSMPAIELQLNDKSLYNEKGTVETISGVIDRTTGTVSVRGMFPNEKGLLHSGSSGNVILPVQYNGSIVIPQTATYEIQNKIFAYKVVDGKAKSVQIAVERVNGGKDYIVSNGLIIGDEIVSEGVGLLREDTPIVVKYNQ
ncbi:MAG: efflux RND transporter periplasmic adaptor subunit [Tannerellaceae bacterium]|jgi:membrane fusion protein (multidrug efflux system)|nr:efflux RND transporter periplasmic adaptor subunit [Tannerellaceae bacterium]